MGIGIDTHGYQEEPGCYDPEPEETPVERLNADLPAIRKVVSAADRVFDGFHAEAEFDIQQPKDSPEYVDCMLRISIEHNDDPECCPKRVLFAALWRIVQEAAGKGWVQLR